MDYLRNESLQAMCRSYLSRLRYMATKHGLGTWLDGIISDNMRGECVATEKEVSMLSRLCDDERISRLDVPKMLDKSYRQANDDGDFDKIKKLRHVGIYSKVSAMLYKSKIEQDGKEQDKE